MDVKDIMKFCMTNGVEVAFRPGSVPDVVRLYLRKNTPDGKVSAEKDVPISILTDVGLDETVDYGLRLLLHTLSCELDEGYSAVCGTPSEQPSQTLQGL